MNHLNAFQIPPPSALPRRLPTLDLDDAQDEDGAETWSQSSHQSHFLFRAMRCESADMDRAMRLYHHSDIVKALLPGLMGFFPDAARVAIPLREQRPTPHVVVTRDGAFVTCLGEGMGVRNLPVIPYASFVPAMHQADQRIHKNRVQAQQLRELSFVQLADALIGGPGHLTREQVRVLDRDPTTYTLPVTKTFMVVWETLSRAWILTGRQNQASRQQEIAIQRLAAIARMCTYLMGHIYEPLVLELLSRLAAYETTMEMEFLTALCRHPEGGDRLLDLAASDKSYPRPRTIAPQLLLSHISTHEENAGRVARRFQQLELLFDGWEMVRVFMTSLCNVGPERLQEMGTRKHLASVRPELVPRSPYHIFAEAELFQDSMYPRSASEFFPTAERAPAVRRAFGERLRNLKPWEGVKSTQKTVTRGEPRVQRNEPCPCQSGLKYKRCCLYKAPAVAEGPSPELLEKAKILAREEWAARLISEIQSDKDEPKGRAAEQAQEIGYTDQQP